MRYFLKLGFLDGAARSRKLDYPLATLGPQNKFFGGYGWRWHFSALASLGLVASPWVAPTLKGRLRQGLWYRWLVDSEIMNCVVRKR